MALQQRSIGTKRPNMCQENIPTPLHQQPEPLITRQDGSMDVFMLLTPNTDPTIPTVAAEIKIRPGNVFFFRLK